jgi:hypothetical protein
MTGLVAGAALVLSLGVTGWESGWAVRYAPNVMEAVAHKRGIAVQSHMLAWTEATDADVGETWLRVVGPAGSATFLVIDLPQSYDKQNLIRRGVIVEIGYANREEICGAAWSGRARDCRVRVIPIRGRG